jgi:hypothetical protein
LVVTQQWGRGGGGDPVMPGSGRVTIRDAYANDERQLITQAAEQLEEDASALITRLGNPTDVHLNDVAYLSGVPASVWEFTIGGYQVLKKWLSYRDFAVTGRELTAAEAREAIAIVRRLTGIILLQPTLDASYEAIRASAFEW